MKVFSSQNIKGYSLFLLAQFMIAISVVAAKFLLQTVPEGIILSFRFSVAALFLFILSVIFKEKGFKALKHISGRDIVLIVSQALCAGIFFNAILLWGLHHTTAAHAGIVISTLPIMVAVFGVIFLRDRLKLSTVVCVGLAVVGLMIMHYKPDSDVGSPHLFGDILVLLALVPEALYYIIARVYDNKLPVFFLSSVINAISIPFCAFFFLSHPEPLAGISWVTLMVLMVSGLASGIFYVLWYLGSRYTRSPLVGLTTAFPPVAIMFLAALFLHEPITVLKIAGMCVILVAIAYPILMKKEDIEKASKKKP